MNKTRKELFLDDFDKKIEKSKTSGALMVFVKIPSCPKCELIINTRENFEIKREYYANAYDDELRLKSNKDIYIDDWFFVAKELNRVSMSNYLVSVQEKSPY